MTSPDAKKQLVLPKRRLPSDDHKLEESKVEDVHRDRHSSWERIYLRKKTYRERI